MGAPKDMPSMSRKKIRLLTFMVLFAFAVLYTGYDIMILYPKSPHRGEGKDVPFSVEKGISPAGLVHALSTAGLISSPGKFELWLKLTGEFAGVRAGEFILQDQMSPSELMAALKGRGIGKGVRITIPEGFTLDKIATVLEEAGLVKTEAFKSACLDTALLTKLGIPGPTAEGFLFPDTYYFNKGVGAPEVLLRMHDNFIRRTASLHLPEGDALRELITLASIVQAEAKVTAEAATIAGVYTNRLNANRFPGRRLQADPTVAYGCNPFLSERPPSCATFKGVLGSNQLQDDLNRYNTYRHPGLPPGPICAPGLTALEAALHPAEVPYLYFVVSTNGGRHTFSTTLAEHEAAVKAYRSARGQ